MFWLIAAGLDNVPKFWSWNPPISRLGGGGGGGGVTVAPPGPGFGGFGFLILPVGSTKSCC